MDEYAFSEPQPADETVSGFAQSVTGQDIHFSSGFAVSASAQNNIEMNDSGSLAVAAGRDASITNGGALGIAVGHDLQVLNGGAIYLVTGGSAEVSNGGALLAVSGALTANHSQVGLVIGPATLNEGSSVLLSGQQALLFGAAFGAVTALLGWLLRRR